MVQQQDQAAYSAPPSPYIPPGPGIYRLVIVLPQKCTIRIGSLGSFILESGIYLYTGSAMGGLRGRVLRHLCADKRPRWHIDYLLSVARVVEVHLLPTRWRQECAWAMHAISSPGATVPVPRFGSSDCRCPAHLIRCGDQYPPPPVGWARLRVDSPSPPATEGPVAAAP